MSFATGVFTTPTLTGNKALTGLGFQPSYMRFTLGQKTGTNQTYAHLSEGSTDGTNSQSVSIFQDTTGGQSLETSTLVIDHMDRVSGTIGEIIKATFVSFDANGFTLNFSVTVSGYHVHYEAFA